MDPLLGTAGTDLLLSIYRVPMVSGSLLLLVFRHTLHWEGQTADCSQDLWILAPATRFFRLHPKRHHPTVASDEPPELAARVYDSQESDMPAVALGVTPDSLPGCAAQLTSLVHTEEELANRGFLLQPLTEEVLFKELRCTRCNKREYHRSSVPALLPLHVC